jgi:hypothetical protein
MGEMTREELSAMTDQELLAYEREHHGDPYMTLAKAKEPPPPGSVQTRTQVRPILLDRKAAPARRVLPPRIVCGSAFVSSSAPHVFSRLVCEWAG